MTRPSELTALIKEGGIPKGLERYFPPCTRDGCTRRKPHNDVLDFQAEFVLAPEKYLALIGGYGSGKTLPAAVLGVLLSKQIRGNRGFVGRRTYSKLHDSTQRIFLDVIQRVGLEYTQREVRDGLPHTIILSNESEIVFRETKDVGRFLGPEYGWFYLDEAAEEPKKTFTDLQSRLRLQQAKRNLKGFITSNPPHHTDWIPELFGIAPGTQERAGSKYRLWQVATTRNPYLPEGYIADLRANHPESEVRRIIDGQYGFAFEGKAVYAPPFEFGRHVAELTPLVGYGVVRVFDWGFHSPAVSWHQFPICDRGRPHWRVQHEYVGANIESEQLADIALEQSAAMFPDHPPTHFLNGADRSGTQVGEKGPGPIRRLYHSHKLHFRTRHVANIDPGLALVRQALRDQCGCGRPVFAIDRRCRHMIDALAGGYHYTAARYGLSKTREKDKPHKDGFYDNIADTLRYAGELFYRPALRDPGIEDRMLTDDLRRDSAPPPPYAWMG